MKPIGQVSQSINPPSVVGQQTDRQGRPVTRSAGQRFIWVLHWPSRPPDTYTCREPPPPPSASKMPSPHGTCATQPQFHIWEADAPDALLGALPEETRAPTNHRIQHLAKDQDCGSQGSHKQSPRVLLASRFVDCVCPPQWHPFFSSSGRTPHFASPAAKLGGDGHISQRPMCTHTHTQSWCCCWVHRGSQAVLAAPDCCLVEMQHCCNVADTNAAPNTAAASELPLQMVPAAIAAASHLHHTLFTVAARRHLPGSSGRRAGHANKVTNLYDGPVHVGAAAGA